MFNIEIIGSNGFIQMGSFDEEFPLDLSYWTTDDYCNHWKDELNSLIHDSDKIVLMSWVLNPDTPGHRRGWILYKENDRVFIQENLFVFGDEELNLKDMNLDKKGVVQSIPERETVSEGEKISEWVVNLKDIKKFLCESSPKP